MMFLKKVWVTIIMPRVGVVMEDCYALIKRVDWENDENSLPLNCSELIAEIWYEIPENSSNGRKRDCE
jgi:hypothetical protein